MTSDTASYLVDSATAYGMGVNLNIREGGDSVTVQGNVFHMVRWPPLPWLSKTKARL